MFRIPLSGARGGVAAAAFAVALCSTATAAPPLIEDVPVPGGRNALANAIGIETVPERGEFVAEVLRVVLARTNAFDARATMTGRIASYLKSVRSADSEAPSSTELVPMPLPASVWSEVVFRRPVPASNLFAEVISDLNAALLARGLAALDDETLRYFAEHPAMITGVYEHDAAVFSAFAVHLHIRNGRVVPPGGQGAIGLWEALLGENAADPQRFVAALFSKSNGRLAYLYDTIATLDSGRAAFALGLWIDDPARRLEQFRALAAVATSGFHEWSARTYYFKRPTHDLVLMLLRIQVDPSGKPRFPASREFWQRAFGGGELTSLKDDSLIDAGWLAERIVTDEHVARIDRLDQLAFGQRAFDADPASLPDVLLTVQALPRFRALVLTLETIGLRHASAYAPLVRHAERLSRLDKSRAPIALSQFQGAVAVIARLVSVRSIDRPTAEKLLASLAAVPLTDGQYRGGVAEWLRVQLQPALPPAASIEEALLSALAGSPGRTAARSLTWEGQQYAFDLAASELRRLQRLRSYQGGPSIDTALDNLAKLQQAGGSATLPSAAFEQVDSALARAFVSIAYALALNLPPDAERLTGRVARRHDFGLESRGEDARVRTAWALPTQVRDEGVPWHVTGAILGLDVAFGSVALRRMEEAVPVPPAIGSVDEDVFAATLALMNGFALRDDASDALGRAIARGEHRIEQLAGSSELAALADEIAMDGWRRRALDWTVAHDPQRTRSYFSLAEVLQLGGGRDLEVNAWGMSALAGGNCFCTELLASRLWTALVGRPETGLLVEVVPDLNLRLAVVLHEMNLPASLIKAVLPFALTDFFDHARPPDASAWLTLVRTAQAVTRERIEDYVAAAAAGGALLADGSLNPGGLR